MQTKTITVTDTKELDKVDLIAYALRKLAETTPYRIVRLNCEDLIKEIEAQNKPANG